MLTRRLFLGMGAMLVGGILTGGVEALAAAAPKKRRQTRAPRSAAVSGGRARPAAKPDERPDESPRTARDVSAAEPDLAPQSARAEAGDLDDVAPDVRDYLYKMRNYDLAAPGDVILSPARRVMLDSVMARLNRLQNHIGHGWFYLLGLDEAVRYAKRGSVGAFPRAELDFMDELFYTPATAYGFLDKKPLEGFTAQIDKGKVVKVPGMGNFVYKGDAEKTWKEIQRVMGPEVVLSSGVRGVIKQFHLFLAKAQSNGGNLSLASRSLAPPGYSFHGVGDFDVGQRGYGGRNFTVDFTLTPVFKALSERGFITLRYPRDNLLGVRFEPWHVKVV